MQQRKRNLGDGSDGSKQRKPRTGPSETTALALPFIARAAASPAAPSAAATSAAVSMVIRDAVSLTVPDTVSSVDSVHPPVCVMHLSGWRVERVPEQHHAHAEGYNLKLLKTCNGKTAVWLKAEWLHENSATELCSVLRLIPTVRVKLDSNITRRVKQHAALDKEEYFTGPVLVTKGTDFWVVVAGDSRGFHQFYRLSKSNLLIIPVSPENAQHLYVAQLMYVCTSSFVRRLICCLATLTLR